MDIKEIQKILPHRFPFLFVDEVLEFERGKRIVALKNVTINEWYLQGHFPSYPVMPGVLVVEALAQAGGVLLLSEEKDRGKLVYFSGIDKAKFRKPVFPGSTLRLEVTPLRIRQRTGKMSGRAFVGDVLVAEAELMFVMTDIEI